MLVVTGYTHQRHNGKRKYHQVEGPAIVYFEHPIKSLWFKRPPKWKLSITDDTTTCVYETSETASTYNGEVPWTLGVYLDLEMPDFVSSLPAGPAAAVSSDDQQPLSGPPAKLKFSGNSHSCALSLLTAIQNSHNNSFHQL